MSVQISAYISDETKAKLERYSEDYGMKKGYIVEHALEHYLQALYEIPESFVLPVHLEIDEASYKRILKVIEVPQKPTEALKDLMREG